MGRQDDGPLPRSSEWDEGRSRPSWQGPEDWQLEEDEEEREPLRRSQPTTNRRRGGEPHRYNVPEPVVSEITDAAGGQRGSKLAARLAEATRHYDQDRYRDALRVLRPLADEVPKAASVRELYGLTLYQEGQWRQAVTQLEAFRALSGSYDQHPVLADCYRALHRYTEVGELWDDLREASPSAPLVAEGRIVAAGALADQGKLREAIALLSRSARPVRHPDEHHLRQWYTLADLYERAGDLPQARRLFQQINAASPGAYDVRQRLRSLR